MQKALPSLEKLQSTLPSLVAEAGARAVEFESARRLAPDFVAKLKHAGAYKILIPESSGGCGASLPQWFEILLRFAEADASTSWIVGHANICASIIYAAADPRLRDELLADADGCAAWSSVPHVKTVSEEADGIRISGSWSFVSGCTGATFVGGMVALSPGPDGEARMVAALAPIAQATIEETWDVMGLLGTGSHDVCFKDVLVPWHRTFPWPAGTARSAYPIAAVFPGSWFISIGAAATHLGLARRALDEARHTLRDKVDRYSGKAPIRNPATQRTLEAAEGLWFACRAGMREALTDIWDAALRGEAPTPDLKVQARVAAVTAAQRGAEIVRQAYDVAGTTAFRRTGVFQRLLRDASCLTHHVSSSLASYELTGRVRCGFDPISHRV
jgi:alkylation response protein AidB-like acyl-CoA dehydrogenase